MENVINALYKDSSSALSSQVSLHGILILLLTKIKVEPNGKKCGMINAFLLAWFTHLITKILSDLTFKLFGPDAVLELFEEPEKETEKNEVPPEDQNGTKKAKKGHLRRRRRNDDSENDSENDSEYDEDESDLDSNSDFDDDDSDSELIDSDENSDDDSIVIEEESNIISDLHMMRSLQNHPMLESFRLCCLWFMSSKDIIEELEPENTNILWQRLASLINLTSLSNEKYEKDPELQQIYQQKENFDIVFPEDKLSHGMKIFGGFHKNLDFENSSQISKNNMVNIFC